MSESSTILGLRAVDVALVGAAVSVASAWVAARLAWASKFKGAELVGCLSHVVVWTRFLGADEKGRPSSVRLTPHLWLHNVGAKPMLVEALRLLVTSRGSPRVALSATDTVPIAAITEPNRLSNWDEVFSGGGPAAAFVVGPGETWTCNFAFSITDEAATALQGPVDLSVEVRELGASRFLRVHSAAIDFGVAPWVCEEGKRGSHKSWFMYATHQRRGSLLDKLG